MQLSFLNIDWDLGINITICGIVIVFSMLVLLVFVLTIFGLFFKERKPTVSNAQTTPSVAKTANKITSTNDDETIAVIAAAVASMYDGTGVTPIIRRIKPASKSSRPSWTSAGLYENTKAF